MIIDKYYLIRDDIIDALLDESFMHLQSAIVRRKAISGMLFNENIKRLRFASTKGGKPVSVNFKTGDNMKVDPITARAITKLHSQLSPENKITLVDKISNDPDSFKKVASFAHKNLTYKDKEEPKK
jgi:hypothetical protein